MFLKELKIGTCMDPAGLKERCLSMGGGGR